MKSHPEGDEIIEQITSTWDKVSKFYNNEASGYQPPNSNLIPIPKVYALHSTSQIKHNLTLKQSLVHSPNAINDCTLSKNGKVAVSALQEGMLKIWSVTHGTEIKTLKVYRGELSLCAVDEAGETVVAVDEDASLRIWDINGGVEKFVWEEAYQLYGCAISDNGKIVVFVDGWVVQVLNVESGQIQTLGGGPSINNVAINGDGSVIVIAMDSLLSNGMG